MEQLTITESAEKYLDELLGSQDKDTAGIKIFVSEPGTPRAETCIAYAKEDENFDDYLDKANPAKLYFVSTKVTKSYADIKYHSHDSFLFGSETKGLPKEIMDEYDGITVPMQDGSRSLNLSNCVSIVAYEAWRQLDFAI